MSPIWQKKQTKKKRRDVSEREREREGGREKRAESYRFVFPWVIFFLFLFWFHCGFVVVAAAFESVARRAVHIRHARARAPVCEEPGAGGEKRCVIGEISFRVR